MVNYKPKLYLIFSKCTNRFLYLLIWIGPLLLIQYLEFVGTYFVNALRVVPNAFVKPDFTDVIVKKIEGLSNLCQAVLILFNTSKEQGNYILINLFSLVLLLNPYKRSLREKETFLRLMNFMIAEKQVLRNHTMMIMIWWGLKRKPFLK